MNWRMPSETARHDRTWMAFPREGTTLGSGDAWKQTGYDAWTAVAHCVAEFEPVTMIIDPIRERTRAPDARQPYRTARNATRRVLDA